MPCGASCCAARNELATDRALGGRARIPQLVSGRAGGVAAGSVGRSRCVGLLEPGRHAMSSGGRAAHPQTSGCSSSRPSGQGAGAAGLRDSHAERGRAHAAYRYGCIRATCSVGEGSPAGEGAGRAPAFRAAFGCPVQHLKGRADGGSLGSPGLGAQPRREAEARVDSGHAPGCAAAHVESPLKAAVRMRMRIRMRAKECDIAAICHQAVWGGECRVARGGA